MPKAKNKDRIVYLVNEYGGNDTLVAVPHHPVTREIIDGGFLLRWLGGGFESAWLDAEDAIEFITSQGPEAHEWRTYGVKDEPPLFAFIQTRALPGAVRVLQHG